MVVVLPLYGIHLQNSFPIMGHLCCITVCLMDLYIPRGVTLMPHHPLWNEEFSSSFGSSGMNWSSFLDSSRATWDRSQFESVMVDIQEGSDPIAQQQEGKEQQLYSK